MLRTIVSQHVKLIGEFVVEEGAAEIIDEVYESDAKVEYDVEACVCDEDHEECIEDYEAKINTALNLCIWSTSNEVEILDVAQVLMEQNKDQNTKFSMKAIENYNINDLTKVDILDHKANGILKDVGHWGLVSTRLVTKWFDEEPPKELMILGTVDLQFRERRRNVRVRFEETPPQRSVKEDFHLSIKLDGGSGATSLGLLAPTVVALLGFLFV